MASTDLVRENSTAGWLADKPSERGECGIPVSVRIWLGDVTTVVPFNSQHHGQYQLDTVSIFQYKRQR